MCVIRNFNSGDILLNTNVTKHHYATYVRTTSQFKVPSLPYPMLNRYDTYIYLNTNHTNMWAIAGKEKVTQLP